MREIKFRAWYQGKMWYKPYGDECLSEGMPLNETIQGMVDEGQILMQYANFKDKRGIKIYEHDILKGPTGLLWEVKFDRAAYRLFHLNNESGHIYLIGDPNMYPLEVIGNIYENPELLKEAQ